MKILVLLPRFPYPLDKGDKLRAYHQIAELAKRHEVYLFALSHQPRSANCQLPTVHFKIVAVDTCRIRWWESLWGVLKALLGGKPLQLGYWTSRRAQKAYARWERQVQPDVVYCQMVRTLPTVAGSPCRKVLDYQDALSLNTRRRMERTHGLLRLILNYEYKALQRTEQQCLSLFDATTVISPVDRDAISPSVHLVPNGVDTDYFKVDSWQMADGRTGTNTANCQLPTANCTLLFTGNMSYAPNVDAACWLVKEIMPLVWRRQPRGINVLIAGADPKPAVRALASERVTVSGRLPDIRAAYAAARIFVAPMRIGSGMQNKLLEAMAMRLPCVTTPLAATPLGATPWEHLLVGDTAEQIADMIVKLTAKDLHDTIADGGHRFVTQRFSWSAAVAPLEKIIETLKP